MEVDEWGQNRSQGANIHAYSLHLQSYLPFQVMGDAHVSFIEGTLLLGRGSPLPSWSVLPVKDTCTIFAHVSFSGGPPTLRKEERRASPLIGICVNILHYVLQWGVLLLRRRAVLSTVARGDVPDKGDTLEVIPPGRHLPLAHHPVRHHPVDVPASERSPLPMQDASEAAPVSLHHSAGLWFVLVYQALATLSYLVKPSFTTFLFLKNKKSFLLLLLEITPQSQRECECRFVYSQLAYQPCGHLWLALQTGILVLFELRSEENISYIGQNMMILHSDSCF